MRQLSAELLTPMAVRGLDTYTLRATSLSFIRHGDCATFRVGGSGGDYLMRIHVPVTQTLGTHGADLTTVTSELLWLEALGRETELVLQKPVRNRQGELVTQIYLEDETSPVNCSLLHWVEGQPYNRDLETPATARQIGRTLATLHLHAERWTYPTGFTRPRRDAAYFTRVLEQLKPAVLDGRIAETDFAVLAHTVPLVADLLQRQPKYPGRWGIMHADAHKGNLLLHEGQIRLIDFSFCAFGDYMFDLGIALSDMRPNLHSHCLDGYRELRALPNGYPELIEALFLGSIVGAFSFWVENPAAQDLLARKVPQVVAEFAEPFLAGERFWLGGMR